MAHARHDTSVPIPDALRSLVAVACQRAPSGSLSRVFGSLLGDFELDDRIVAQVAPERVQADALVPAELHNGGIAFPEVVPFAWLETGSYFGHLVLAEELAASDWPVVLLDPVGGITWIAADTKQALEARAVAMGRHRAKRGEPRVAEDPHAQALIRALGLTPDYDKPGTRPSLPPDPIVPPGYRHASSSTGVGVLAPISTFDDRFDLDAALEDFEHLETTIRGLIDRGALATALEALRALRALGDGDAEKHALNEMIGVYAALGRPTMARRAEAQRDALVP